MGDSASCSSPGPGDPDEAVCIAIALRAALLAVQLDVGPVLHPDDLAADKVLAMWGRGERAARIREAILQWSKRLLV
ncbi:MAG: hypothetical protein ACRDRA_01785 [Pseudonocardiaceae bacterium]